MIVDPQTLEHEYLDNGASQVRTQGAGIQAAEIVARAGAKIVLTGFVGPKAFQALQALGIEAWMAPAGLTAKQALSQYRDGRLERMLLREYR